MCVCVCVCVCVCAEPSMCGQVYVELVWWASVHERLSVRDCVFMCEVRKRVAQVCECVCVCVCV